MPRVPCLFHGRRTFINLLSLGIDMMCVVSSAIFYVNKSAAYVELKKLINVAIHQLE